MPKRQFDGMNDDTICDSNRLYDTLYLLIYQYLGFIDKLAFRRVCKNFRKFKLTDFYHIDIKYKKIG